jgi:hypothetical protein
MIKRSKLTETQIKRSNEKRELNERTLSFYEEIWKERKHYSEINGAWLGDTIRTYFFHHILPKNSYPEYRFNKENIILLTLEQHMKVENTPQYYEEINTRRTLLLNK